MSIDTQDLKDRLQFVSHTDSIRKRYQQMSIDGETAEWLLKLIEEREQRGAKTVSAFRRMLRRSPHPQASA